MEKNTKPILEKIISVGQGASITLGLYGIFQDNSLALGLGTISLIGLNALDVYLDERRLNESYKMLYNINN